MLISDDLWAKVVAKDGFSCSVTWWNNSTCKKSEWKIKQKNGPVNDVAG